LFDFRNYETKERSSKQSHFGAVTDIGVASSRPGTQRLDSTPVLIFSAEADISSFPTEPSQGQIPIGPSSSWQKRTFRIDVSQLGLLNDKKDLNYESIAQEANRKHLVLVAVVVF
jgi:hypothetical protein